MLRVIVVEPAAKLLCEDYGPHSAEVWRRECRSVASFLKVIVLVLVPMILSKWNCFETHVQLET